ncbi:MAG: hypothetical protein BJ554DRAFT_6868, partial [Olpidium bornovanus]
MRAGRHVLPDAHSVRDFRPIGWRDAKIARRPCSARTHAPDPGIRTPAPRRQSAGRNGPPARLARPYRPRSRRPGLGPLPARRGEHDFVGGEGSAAALSLGLASAQEQTPSAFPPPLSPRLREPGAALVPARMQPNGYAQHSCVFSFQIGMKRPGKAAYPTPAVVVALLSFLLLFVTPTAEAGTLCFAFVLQGYFFMTDMTNVVIRPPASSQPAFKDVYVSGRPLLPRLARRQAQRQRGTVRRPQSSDNEGADVDNDQTAARQDRQDEQANLAADQGLDVQAIGGIGGVDPATGETLLALPLPSAFCTALGQDLADGTQKPDGNLQTGFFTVAATEYYTQPQTLNSDGIIKGALTVGLNDAAGGDGRLSTDVPANTLNTAGVYRICTMVGAFSHQPVVMPIAQRGAQDDCIRIN